MCTTWCCQFCFKILGRMGLWYSNCKRINMVSSQPVFICLLTRGFPTGVENIWGLFKIWWEGLSQYMGGAWGGLKMLSKNTCDGVHLIVKLLVISLQACTFIKNELLHTYFWRILARFSVIIYCAFSRNHFMEGYFTFQWGGLLFRWGGGFIFMWG